MIYLLISICCSVTVAVLLKLARRYKINIVQAVTWNYLFAIVLSLFFFKPSFSELTSAPVNSVYIALGILLPVVFWFLAGSVRNIGIVKTDIAQRLSLFLPIMAAYFIFKEQFSLLKIAGLSVGFIAIFFTLYKKTAQKNEGLNWLYPIFVFIGFGIIDILFKKIAQIKAIPYTSSLIVIFILAFVISLVAVFYLSAFKKQKIEFVNFICGCILGFFNFFNILFYLKAHRMMADNPSVVFAAMNMGVIIAGSLVGILIFKEKLNKLNYWGLALALLAILLITNPFS
ncbi:drug/metabolite transporter (DMT)-like permease [Pedobacter africanus]|uniref:Drug/metabolite transporter (DMT)-like permease n=1 Tax=Pedobacter africanus TaxID=151894 RepID=A0ACC6KT12_9SPHI|nr:EamA/RhaT family transporter [Pedobacter africanus]MDR6782236.1 drug/metabolite transporter (DMT)-like permease [Pedobacter africanus]